MGNARRRNQADWRKLDSLQTILDLFDGRFSILSFPVPQWKVKNQNWLTDRAGRAGWWEAYLERVDGVKVSGTIPDLLVAVAFTPGREELAFIRQVAFIYKPEGKW